MSATMNARIEPALRAELAAPEPGDGSQAAGWAVPPERQRMLTLAWYPGAHMHPRWWDRLELANWRSVYAELPACRAPVDEAIVARRAWPLTALNAAPSDSQLQLMRLEPRLPALSVAAGLAVLRRADYLLLREYRKSLAPWLSDAACDQLLLLAGIKRASHRDAPLAAEALPERAGELGAAWLARDAGSCAASFALSMLLPPASPRDACAPLPESSAGPFLLKLARFL
jgi:hypothetical protein